MTLPECIEEIQTNIDGKNILPSVELKLRGLEIDNELNFTSHIQSICKKATCGSKIAVLSRFKNVIPINAKLHIYMRMNVRMKSRGWEDNRRTPFYNTFQHVNSTLGHQHTKAPMAATLSPFMCLQYPPNPWCEWCDVWRLTTTPGSTSPTLFEQWCGFFYVPACTRTLDTCKCCEMGSIASCPYSRRLDILTICRCHYKGSTFLSVI